MGVNKLITNFVAAGALGLFSLQVSSAVVSFELNHEFSGATAPAGPAPWMTITIDDGGTAGSVDLTISNVGLTGTEFASRVFVNYEGGSPLSISNTGGVAPVEIDFTVDTHKADGDGFFDILFRFETSNTGDRFGAAESSSYSIVGAGITAADFNFLSSATGANGGNSGGKGPFLAAAHIQAIYGECGLDNPGCSGWIAPIPVPAAVWLFGSGLLGLVGVARRKKA